MAGDAGKDEWGKEGWSREVIKYCIACRKEGEGRSGRGKIRQVVFKKISWYINMNRMFVSDMVCVIMLIDRQNDRSCCCTGVQNRGQHCIVACNCSVTGVSCLYPCPKPSNILPLLWLAKTMTCLPFWSLVNALVQKPSTSPASHKKPEQSDSYWIFPS